MKRSEMVDSLSKYLHNDWSITEGKDHRVPIVIAEDIIEYLEKAGMLPPSRHLDMFDKTDNSWEPEDD